MRPTIHTPYFASKPPIHSTSIGSRSFRARGRSFDRSRVRSDPSRASHRAATHAPESRTHTDRDDDDAHRPRGRADGDDARRQGSWPTNRVERARAPRQGGGRGDRRRGDVATRTGVCAREDDLWKILGVRSRGRRRVWASEMGERGGMRADDRGWRYGYRSGRLWSIEGDARDVTAR